MGGLTTKYGDRTVADLSSSGLARIPEATEPAYERFKEALFAVVENRTDLLVKCVSKIRGQDPNILTSRVCGPATKFLRYILEQENFTVERLDTLNVHDHYPALDHAILTVRSPTGDSFIVDPSYLQFVRRLHNSGKCSVECLAVYEQFPRILIIEPGKTLEAGNLLMRLWQKIKPHLGSDSGVLGFNVEDQEININSLTTDEASHLFAQIWDLSRYEPSRFRTMDNEIDKLNHGTLELPYSIALADILDLLKQVGLHAL